MTIAVKHKFTSAKADGLDSTRIQPSNWNDTHEMTMAAGKVVGRDSSAAGLVQELAISVDSTQQSMTPPSGTTAQRPASPSAGMMRYNSTTGKFEGYTTAWGTLGGGCFISDTAPGNPQAGDLWWKSDEGQMYVYYSDGTSSQWVIANAFAGGSAYLPLAGGIITGNLDVSGTAKAASYRVDGAYPSYSWYPTTGTANQRSFRIQVDTNNFSIIGQDDSGLQQNFPFQITWGGDISLFTNTLVKISGSGLGYGTGSGGTVTQLTSKSTNVILNKANGKVTMNNAALAAGAKATFAINNNTVTLNDTIIMSFDASLADVNINYTLAHSVGNGAVYVTLKNDSAGSRSEAVAFNFAIIKAVIS